MSLLLRKLSLGELSLMTLYSPEYIIRTLLLLSPYKGSLLIRSFITKFICSPILTGIYEQREL